MHTRTHAHSRVRTNTNTHTQQCKEIQGELITCHNLRLYNMLCNIHHITRYIYIYIYIYIYNRFSNAIYVIQLQNQGYKKRYMPSLPYNKVLCYAAQLGRESIINRHYEVPIDSSFSTFPVTASVTGPGNVSSSR